MPLRVYNTLTRQKEDFQTVRAGKVGMYVCGPTVYKPSHVGHMVGPVIFDTVKRYLTYLGYQVTWVVNITDVDDKLIKRAAETGTTVKELAERMTADYIDCLKKLNVTGIDHMPRATEHIAEMIGIMRGLIEKGYAYAAGGDVYFDISKDHDYGKLCNRPRAAGGRGPHRGQRKEAQPRRLRPVERVETGRAGVGLAVGPGAAGVAHRMLGDEHEAPRRDARHSRRRARLAVPAPRERAGAVRIVHGEAVLALLDAQRVAEDGHGQDGGLGRQRG
jgi:hypothetical protein